MVICVGDSVTSGQGLDASLSYPRQLSTRVAGRAGKIPVTQMARPGADSGALKQDVAPNLMRVADGARPVAVVMLGHNDFLDWSGGSARRAFVGSAAGSSASEHGDPRDAHRPRLLRLWRWFTTAWMGEVPAFKGRPHGQSRRPPADRTLDLIGQERLCLGRSRKSGPLHPRRIAVAAAHQARGREANSLLAVRWLEGPSRQVGDRGGLSSDLQEAVCTRGSFGPRARRLRRSSMAGRDGSRFGARPLF